MGFGLVLLSFTWCLGLIWDDASYKVRVRGPEVGHQLVQILLQEISQVLFSWQ